MNTELSKRLKEFDKAHDLLIELGGEIFEADGARIFAHELLIFASLKRALSLLSGFKHMIECRNFNCAAALLRLQLDNALRVYASSLVDDHIDFTVKILKGIEVRKLKDRDNKAMTDKYLVEKMSAIFPDINHTYKQCCGYIHLSEKHIFDLFDETASEGRLNMEISDVDRDSFPEERYLDVTVAFLEITKVYAKLISSWLHCKDKVGRERKNG